jgi:hypothetical protein
MKHLKQMLATYVYSHCNICNIPDLLLQHLYEHLQHTSETFVIIKTYVYNIGGEKEAGRLRPSG